MRLSLAQRDSAGLSRAQRDSAGMVNGLLHLNDFYIQDGKKAPFFVFALIFLFFQIFQTFSTIMLLNNDFFLLENYVKIKLKLNLQRSLTVRYPLSCSKVKMEDFDKRKLLKIQNNRTQENLDLLISFHFNFFSKLKLK